MVLAGQAIITKVSIQTPLGALARRFVGNLMISNDLMMITDALENARKHRRRSRDLELFRKTLRASEFSEGLGDYGRF